MNAEILIALMSKHIDERIKSLPSSHGPRGFRGPAGADGRDGRDFVFSEHEEEIRSWAKEYALKFSDLSYEEIAQLRGPAGKDGTDGKNFVWEENREGVLEVVKSTVDEMREELKLKFSDLDSDDIERIRGPRGRDGRDGRDFVFDEHREYFDSLKLKFSDLTQEEIEDLRLHFSDLTEEEKATLKLRFSDLTDDERLSLRGARGARGQRGKNGVDGRDGKDGLSIRGLPGPVGLRGLPGSPGINGLNGSDGLDAPHIVAIDTRQTKDGLVFVFEFSDGTMLETSGIDIPAAKTYVIGGGRGGGSVTEYETRVDEPSSTVTYVGKAYIGASTADAIWQIKKILISGTETSIEWANSSDSFSNIWDNRASLSYG
jgi:hypothetical protein